MIIAEAGVNHNGRLDIALKLCDKAKLAGADCVKFQTFIAKNLASKYAKKAEYQKTKTNQNQLHMLKNLELSFDDFIILKNYCDKINLCFCSSPFDLESIDFLTKLNLKFLKIPSGEITNLPYLLKISKSKSKSKIILSTGMSTITEIQQTLKILNSDVSLLHCTTQYPTPYEDVNLNAINTLKNTFNLPVGYSDHTLGVEIGISAVALGATIIEKHFTLDTNMQGPDHKSSLNYKDFKYFVTCIKNVQKALGDGIKKVSKSEQDNICIVRKSIVAKTYIKKNTILTEQNITTKRPANGITPMRWFDVVGKLAIKDFEEDEPIIL